MKKHTFIENGESRLETAALLVSAAEDSNISRRDILPTGKGFWISETLADVLVEEGILAAEAPEEAPVAPEKAPEAPKDPETPKEATEASEGTKTSGNRAAKKNTKTPKE